MEKILDQNKASHPVNGYKWMGFGLLLLLGLSITVGLEATFRKLPNASETQSLPASASLQTQIGDFSSIDLPILDFERVSAALSPNRERQYTRLNRTDTHKIEPMATSREKLPKGEKSPIPDLYLDQLSKKTTFEAFNQDLPSMDNRPIQKGNAIDMVPDAPAFRSKKIALALQVSPDFSAIQFNQLPPSGRGIGLTLEYFLADTWSISGGAIHSKKTYTHGEGYWEGYPAAHQALRGDCWIFEVPVNIRYYPFSNLKDKWFISTGLSSYFMIKEKYALTYENYEGKRYSQELDIRGSNQHVFGIWNLGLGYERKISDKLAVQVEPYYRLPLVGIGEGNLDLKSMGIFFGIKYYPSQHQLKF
ncbi:MAG: hypothetical protein R6V72_21940 [Cyclobacterium sp.]|uniref:hypothetical protein n=1 Tax=Cyclobacterium sp. TaxID=1966343 RepID=UPI0039706BC7